MLKEFVYSVCFICLASGFSHSQSTTSPQTDKQKLKVVSSNKIDEKIGLIEGKVVEVNDGDNISVETRDRKVYAIRLQGIDAPEEKQNFGKKAGKKLADLIMKKEVKVIVHRKDASDRYIGSVYLDGKDISLKQIENGMAWYFKPHGADQTPEDRTRYAQAELVARAKGVGLWDDKDPVPPWVFRGDKPFVEAPVTQSTSGAVKDPSKKYILGPRGGCYYVSESGSKVYVKDKSFCSN